MVDWQELLDDDEQWRTKQNKGTDEADWRQEAADSLCELFYETYRAQRRGSAAGTQRIDHRPGSDYQRYLDSHLRPLAKYGVWESLFPNETSAKSAQALDEALHLLADTKLVDRIYSGDIVTANKLVNNIQKKRAKYLEL
ncbi:MAG: hypothetical protein GY822_26405 [Deltaproteobacteria bacterium]|nr:hypothetical protein [Deltaproteobacteria bacterium]